MSQNLDSTLETYISWQLEQFKGNFFSNCDVIAYYGGIFPWSKDVYQPKLELIGQMASGRANRFLVIILNTNGGSVEAVEKMVEITRHFYQEVYFIIPDMAMSAGTIWCMSGDKIHMNYASSLGPIDPQVQSSDGKWVPALGYLDKVEEMIAKSRDGTITQAELMMLSQLDLAHLRRYEQARELSVDLLKKWLVEYKFREWTVHQSDQKSGKLVTRKEKEARAKKIATSLSDNGKWHSHGRTIGINTLINDLRIKIEDFTYNNDFSVAIKNLHSVINEYMYKTNRQVVVLSSFPFSDPVEA
ncbi:SDH family Clp fold serine proteinase [Kluyvera georgiana]|uniref:SDH family Clp fold serine proteinase n=1 Tax=Kluyvera georgiana TaxID=73098 RepID=UPI003F674D13